MTPASNPDREPDIEEGNTNLIKNGYIGSHAFTAAGHNASGKNAAHIKSAFRTREFLRLRYIFKTDWIF
jgi:hypothetical protein